jgi:phosphatidylglycerol---prolipoprotein diacylglyceryl transferase
LTRPLRRARLPARGYDVHWYADPVMLRLGAVTVYWYGVLFTAGLFATVWMGHRFFVERGLEERHASNLAFWLLGGLFLGAHVLDVVVYNWQTFVADPSVLLDIRFGLSSHGGAIGVISALFLYAKLYRLDFYRFADAVTLAAVWLFPWIRVGNFINGEVVGRPTDLPWGVIFHVTGLPEPRHPSQLYEAALGIIAAGACAYARAPPRSCCSAATSPCGSCSSSSRSASPSRTRCRWCSGSCSACRAR